MKGRVARPVEGLDDDTLKAISKSEVPDEYAALNDLIKDLQYGKGIEEGRKNRPCAIIAARQIIEGREVVTVVPITHTPPTTPDDAVEIPAALKAHLGLDDLPSWLWPGPDLWPLPGTKPNRYDYGMLPPRFFTHIRDKILQAHLRRRLNRVQRSE